VVRDAQLGDVLHLIAAEHNLYFQPAVDLSERITISLYDLPLHEVLKILLQPRGYEWHLDEDRLTVAPSAAAVIEPPPPPPQPVVRVFQLKYLPGAEVEAVVGSLLTATGRWQLTVAPGEAALAPHRRLVIIDEPPAIERVQQYLAQTDRPPPHVLIEARVLHLGLSPETWQGVNLLPFAAEFGGRPVADGSRYLRFATAQIDTLSAALQSQQGALLLGTPQLLAVDGQPSSVQVGASAAIAGVTLEVLPLVVSDDRVRLRIRPSITDGQIDPATGQWATDAALETTMLLSSGETVVVGGLIQQRDVEMVEKRRVLGNLPLVGQRFQQRYFVPARSEVLVLLTPRIVPEALVETVAAGWK
jgi:type II secretory pathway component GspD/PulD (secretin)